MTQLTNEDFSRLVTHVVIHGCHNPHVLHLDTFKRLEEHGLAIPLYSELDPDFPCDFIATAKGINVVEAMLKTRIGEIES
jgi:hypothetical protein